MIFSKFFSSLQEAPWYRQFLNPVLDEISKDSSLIDIGTGSGKMLEILYKEKNVKSVGTDTESHMLTEAKKKLRNTNAELHLIPSGDDLPFGNNSFDNVTICSVLFHMKEKDIDHILNNSLQVLKEGGKIIVLTPTGNGNIVKLSKNYFSSKNTGIYIWYNATKNRARQWTKRKYLSEYASKHKLDYKSKIVMNGFAQLELLEK